MRDPEAVSGAGGSQASRQHIINLSPCMFNIRLSESDVILSQARAQYPTQTVFIDSHKSFDYSSNVLTHTREKFSLFLPRYLLSATHKICKCESFSFYQPCKVCSSFQKFVKKECRKSLSRTLYKVDLLFYNFWLEILWWEQEEDNPLGFCFVW